MIRIGFIGSSSVKWMGGLNYFKNLFFAISQLQDKEIEIIVFMGKNTDAKIKKVFNQYVTVIEEPMFDKKSIRWYLWKILYKFFNSTYLINQICLKYKIDVLSHTGLTNVGTVKTINWIPDFQHLHLPEMFSKKELMLRAKNYQYLIEKSDLIVLSSYDALKDFNNFISGYTHKVDVLQFVSQPDSLYSTLSKNVLDQYDLPQDFYYLPNQFWKHKNHLLVFEAVRLLVEENIDICIVCTGYMRDYRNSDYIENIQIFIKQYKLERNIKLLGLIDYQNVFALIKYSKAVINPSLFEGWSSTVEECKSVNKNMILSNLDVHKEQYPEAVFFDKNNRESLRDVLKNYMHKNKNKKHDLEQRTKEFSKKYISLIRNIVNEQ